MKAIIFDFDGTLNKKKKGSNCWYEVWKYIDDLDYDNYLYDMYKRKEINANEWFKRIIERYKEKGVKREYLAEISKNIELIDGIDETFDFLSQNNIKIFILSGGIRQIIEDTLTRENALKYIDKVEAYDLIFDKNGHLLNLKKPDLHNPENKQECVELIKQQYKLNANDILFVGNGANDESVYKSGVATLCINPDDTDCTNKTIWHNAIENCCNLTEILKFCETEKIPTFELK